MKIEVIFEMLKNLDFQIVSRRKIAKCKKCGTYIQHPSSGMASRKAIDLVKKKSSETLLLRCHVRPGASKVREGVTEITDEAIELCVAAQAQDGKANKAVVEILSDVGLP